MRAFKKSMAPNRQHHLTQPAAEQHPLHRPAAIQAWLCPARRDALGSQPRPRLPARDAMPPLLAFLDKPNRLRCGHSKRRMQAAHAPSKETENRARAQSNDCLLTTHAAPRPREPRPLAPRCDQQKTGQTAPTAVSNEHANSRHSTALAGTGLTNRATRSKTR